jgi:hypothetical protein
MFMLLKPMLAVERLGILKDVLVPEGFVVTQGEVFVLEEASVFVYSLSDLNQKRQFGREGQGPGEVQVTPWLSNLLYVFPDKILIDSVNKVVEYSRNGEFLNEFRRSEQFTQMMPVADYFVVRKRVQDPTEMKQYSTITWFDPKTEAAKELYRQPFAAQRGQVEMVPDSIHFFIYQDKIFIEQSINGFVIEVYDCKGSPLYSIEKDLERIPLKRADRSELEESLYLDPFMKIGPDNWEQFKSQTKMIYPDAFPAIQDLFLADDRIYVQTYKRMNGKTQFVILDLKGKELGEIYLPSVQWPSYTEQMMGTGVRLYCIEKDEYYYIVEKDEWCELHMVGIK